MRGDAHLASHRQSSMCWYRLGLRLSALVDEYQVFRQHLADMCFGFVIIQRLGSLELTEAT